MNDIEPRDTIPDDASSAHIAELLRIAANSQAFAQSMSDVATMHAGDRANELGLLLDEHDQMRARIVAAIEAAYRLEELESLIEGAAQ